MGLDMYILRRSNTDDTCEIAYWRKANEIHNWMVRNTNYSDDTCMANITRENIEKLKYDCEDILNKCNVVVRDENITSFTNTEYAEQNMPTVDGFFFGSLDYDDWYFRDIVDSVEYCEKILENYSEWLDNGELYYHAWY